MVESKRNIRKFRKKIALLLAVILIINCMPQGIINFSVLLVRGEESLSVAQFQSLMSGYGTVTVEDNQITSIVCSDSAALILLSHVSSEAYQKATITIATTGAADLTKTVAVEAVNYTFSGLGSEESPFSGKIGHELNSSDAAYMALSGDTPLFNAVTTDMTILNGVLRLASTEETTGQSVLFAACVKAGENEAETWNIKILTHTITGQDGKAYYFGGVLNTLEENTTCKIKIEYNNTYSNGTQNNTSELSGAGNIGLFCNTIKSKASLSVEGWTGNYDYAIASTAGNAGALVGEMQDDAILIINPEETVTFTGSVTASAGNAGGLVGSMGENAQCNINQSVQISGTINGQTTAGGIIGSGKNVTFAISDGTKVTVKDASVNGLNGSSNIGGFAGCYEVSESDKLTVNQQYVFEKITLTTGKYAGGVFGVVKNTSTENAATMEITGITPASTSAVTVYGGVIGYYESSDGENTLKLTKSSVTLTSNASSKNVGGLIGSVSGNSNGFSYVTTSDIDVSLSGTNTQAGGLFGNGGDKGNFLDVGTVTVTASVALKSGLVGTMTSGVLRLSGTTDLSGVTKYTENRNTCGQILGARGNTVVYATTDWKINRYTKDLYISDIGTYGEVVRLKSDVIEENVESSNSELFVVDDTKHTVTVHAASNTIGSARDFAAVSVSIQAVAAQGALQIDNATLVANDSTISTTFSVSDNIDLSGTGITGLTRDDGTQTFTGTFDGGNHTITLNIGETYSNNGTTNIGSGQIIGHTYVGLFGKVRSDATIQNVKIAGEMNVCSQAYAVNNSKPLMRIGGVAGAVSAASDASKDTLTITNVKSSINMKIKTASGNYQTLYIGGLVGLAFGNATITSAGNTWDGTITHNNQDVYFYSGGFIGYTERNVTVNSTKDSVQGTIQIEKIAEIENIQVGGMIGGMQVAENGNSNTVKIKDMTIAACITSVDGNSGTIGGLLGYNWYNANVDIDNLVVNDGSVSATNCTFGGLVYTASGYWKIHDDGISITNSTFSGKSSTDTPSALLVARGDAVDNQALYLEVGLSSDETKRAYVLRENTITLSADEKYFDELVGKSIGESGNGVVSIATVQHAPLDQDGRNSYEKQLDTDYQNSQTRYYYNLDSIRVDSASSTNDVVDLSTVDSGEKMLLWSVYQYAHSNIRGYFGKNVGTQISQTIDLTGLSYYPVDYSGSLTIVEGTTITFDNETIETVEGETTENKKPSNRQKQHYMMQGGLFYNITATQNITITVNGLTLAGTVGTWSDENDNSGSGAFICGTVQGTRDTNANVYKVTMALDDIIFQGVTVNDVAGLAYKPLFINKIDSYTSLNLTKVKTENYNSTAIKTKVASSMIGDVGNATTGTDITLAFQYIQLEGYASKSIFSKATLLNAFQYIDASSCSGSYIFTTKDHSEEGFGVTLGKEISNTTSGRNQGKQYYYFDDQSKWVSDEVNTGEENTGDTEYFSKDNRYLPYVFQTEDTTNKTYELDINQISVDIDEGCGTYGDPFIIDTPGQLEAVAAVLNGSPGQEWSVVLNTDVLDKMKETDDNYHTTSDASTSDITYTYNGGKWEADISSDTTDGSVSETTTEYVQAYLRNAYYMIRNTDDEPLTIGKSTDFYGLGYVSGTDVTNAFCGVIIGEDEDTQVSIYLPKDAETNTLYQYGGLVRFGNGCVVKNLNVKFKNQSSDDEDETASVNITYNPTTTDGQGNTLSARQRISFYGSVIGYAINGDNVIDHVQVTQPEVTVNGTEDPTDGDTRRIVNIGGYVGLVGGGSGEVSASNDYANGGGVIFRNMTDDCGLRIVYDDETMEAGVALNQEVDDLIGEGESVKTKKNIYYYANPYVGRVLDGFVCYDGANSKEEFKTTELTNTDKNYKIPTLKSEDLFSITLDEKSKKGTISITSEQQLWVLSAIVNSGAGAQSATKATTKSNAYSMGKTRSVSYDYVGDSTEKEKAKEEASTDETYWGGICSDSDTTNIAAGKQSYLIKKFVASNARAVAAALTSSTKTCYTVSFDAASLDMTAYGNGFRGVGAAFQDNSSGNIRYRDLPLNGVDAGNQNNCTITLKRNVYEYANEQWWTQCIGLFPSVYFQTVATVKNITISGDVNIQYTEDEKVTTTVTRRNNWSIGVEADYIGECSAGGFAGMTAYSSVNNQTITFQNVKTNILNVKGAKYAGGFIGAVGRSSRTWRRDKKFNNNISTTMKQFSFDSCSCVALIVNGGYAAGGFVGEYYCGSDMEVKGTSQVSNSTIALRGDAASDIYTWGENKKIDNGSETATHVSTEQAMQQGFTGAGGVVGFCKNALKINSDQTDNDTFTMDNTTISSVAIQNNTDYGMGGIIGTAKSEIEIYNVKLQNCTIQTDSTGFENTFKSDTTYAYALPVGGICGQTQDFTLKNITLENCHIYNAGFLGGLIGCVNNEKSNHSISMITISNTDIVTQNIHAYDGPAEAGGILGKSSDGAIQIADVTLDGVTVLSDGYAGGISGAQRATVNLTNVALLNCKVVSNKQDSETYYKDATNNPQGYITSSPTKNNVRAGLTTNACAGGIAGCFTWRAKDEKYAYQLNGYNILMKNNTIGNYISNGEIAGKVEAADYASTVSTLSMENIGMQIGGTYKAYDEITDSDKAGVTDGWVGIILGNRFANTATNTDALRVSIVGLSVQDSNSVSGTPYWYCGNDNNLGVDGYVIRADYMGSSDKYSTVTTMPSKVFDSGLTKTGDGVCFTTDAAGIETTTAIGTQIAIDAQNETKKSTEYNLVSQYGTKFIEEGAYADKVADYKSEQTTFGGTNFPILVIETSTRSVVNDEIKSYISLLTNWDQGTDSSKIKSISTETYSWTDGAWEKLEDKAKSLTVDGTTFKLQSGNYDNEGTKFTLIDIEYEMPYKSSDGSNGSLVTIKDLNNAYHLFIPVYVKKVLQFNVNVTIDNGTQYYLDAYTQKTNATLAGNGDQITAYIAFQYDRTYEEWLDAINAGDNFLWNYNKKINLDLSAIQNENYPENTETYVVDPNQGGLAYHAVSTANGVFNFADAVSVTDESTNWSPVYLSDLLVSNYGLVAQMTTSGEGALVMCEATDPERSFRIENQYYKAYIEDSTQDSTEESATPTFYTIKASNEISAQNLLLSEGYYVTLQMDVSGNEKDFQTFNMGYIDMNLPDAASQESGITVKGIPSLRIEAESASAGYLYGQYVEQSLVVNATDETYDIASGPEVVMDGEFSTMYVVLTSTVSLNGAASSYISELDPNLSFSLSLRQKTETDGKFTPLDFVGGTRILYSIYVDDEEKYVGTLDLQESESKVTIKYPNENKELNGYVKEGKKIYLKAKIQVPSTLVSDQFPLNINGTESVGALVQGSTNFVYTHRSAGTDVVDNMLARTSLNCNDADKDYLYYRQNVSNATLSYNSYANGQSIGTSGGFSQLGTNASDPDRNYLLYSNSHYDASDVADTILREAVYIRYDFKLYCKQDDGSYKQVTEALDKYLSNIKYSEDSFFSENETINGNNIFFWSADDTDTVSKDVQIMLKVLTGSKKVNQEGADDSQFEQDSLLYANYKLELTATLLDKDLNELDGTVATDDIIYTNARINYEFVDSSASENVTN